MYIQRAVLQAAVFVGSFAATLTSGAAEPANLKLMVGDGMGQVIAQSRSGKQIRVTMTEKGKRFVSADCVELPIDECLGFFYQPVLSVQVADRRVAILPVAVAGMKDIDLVTISIGNHVGGFTVTINAGDAGESRSWKLFFRTVDRTGFRLISALREDGEFGDSWWSSTSFFPGSWNDDLQPNALNTPPPPSGSKKLLTKSKHAKSPPLSAEDTFNCGTKIRAHLRNGDLTIEVGPRSKTAQILLPPEAASWITNPRSLSLGTTDLEGSVRIGHRFQNHEALSQVQFRLDEDKQPQILESFTDWTIEVPQRICHTVFSHPNESH